MQISVHIDAGQAARVVDAVPLTAAAYAPFGDVVQNPRPDLHPSGFSSTDAAGAPYNPVSANQGFAIKYQHPTRPLNLYAQAPSRQPAVAVANVFVCAARQVDGGGGGALAVKVLERHPFTTQTFSPLSRDGSDVRYLVIVAPSLDPGSGCDALPHPASTPPSSAWAHPGRGLPDMARLQAFVATGAQAVTYGAGTWHAPMVALGPPGSCVDFFVTQFANGVAAEDCQEVLFVHHPDDERVAAPGQGGLPQRQPAVSVRLPSQASSSISSSASHGLWRKPDRRARL